MADIKNKLIVYIGSFISQFSVFLVILLVVRNSSVKNIALLAIVDGALLFLPFFLTLVSERSAVIACYERNIKTGLMLFATGYIIVIVFTTLVLTFSFFIQWLVDNQFIILSSLVIIAAAGTGLFNIQFQRYLVLEDYFGLAIMQTKKGVSMIILVLLLQKTGLEAIYIYPVVLLGGSLIAVYSSIFLILSELKLKLFRIHIKYLFRMGQVALLILFLGYTLANVGRISLEIYDKDQDLAVLLLYIKSALLVTVVMVPFATFLKPIILKEYKFSREVIPDSWKQMILFNLFVSVGAISSFSILWSLWGFKALSPDYYSFAIAIAGATSMWLMSSIVELYFEHSAHLYKKIVVYSIPILLLVGSMVLIGTNLTFNDVLIAISLTQFSILTIGLIVAFQFTRILRQYIFLLASLGSILLIGKTLNYLAADYSSSNMFLISTLSVTAICGLFSLYYLFKYVKK